MRMTLLRIYMSRIEGYGDRGRPPVKWISRDNDSEGELVGEGMSVLRGSAGAGKVGDTPAKATSLREVLLREQGVRYRAVL